MSDVINTSRGPAKAYRIVGKQLVNLWRCKDCAHIWEHERSQVECPECRGEAEIAPMPR